MSKITQRLNVWLHFNHYAKLFIVSVWNPWLNVTSLNEDRMHCSTVGRSYQKMLQTDLISAIYTVCSDKKNKVSATIFDDSLWCPIKGIDALEVSWVLFELIPLSDGKREVKWKEGLVAEAWCPDPRTMPLVFDVALVRNQVICWRQI